jgi:hypothetical protein
MILLGEIKMRKILLLLLSGVCSMSFASSLDMSTLMCDNNYKLTTATTLADVQKNCMISKQKTSNGMYFVEFTNVTTKKTVTCSFASNTPTARLNSCK